MMMEFYVTVIISGRGRGSVLQVSLVSAHRVLPGTGEQVYQELRVCYQGRSPMN